MRRTTDSLGENRRRLLQAWETGLFLLSFGVFFVKIYL